MLGVMMLQNDLAADLGKKGMKGLLYMFYCICLEECDWISRQFARQIDRLKGWAEPGRLRRLKS